MILLETLRSSRAAAVELHDALHAPPSGDLPALAVGCWFMDPYGQQNSGRYEPAPVCRAVSGARLGWVAFAAKPFKTARGVRVPAGWSCWASVKGWPYHQPCASREEGIAMVTAALVEAGWFVHPLENPPPSAAPKGVWTTDGKRMLPPTE